MVGVLLVHDQRDDKARNDQVVKRQLIQAAACNVSAFVCASRGWRYRGPWRGGRAHAHMPPPHESTNLSVVLGRVVGCCEAADGVALHHDKHNGCRCANEEDLNRAAQSICRRG
eukprot:SAG11_NODE_5416_length_1566_cov_2.108384_2_plen_114_part_00